ncbi:MAG: hypothetical protein AAGA90_20070 [Actinomycetota bacterium]
MDVDDALRVLGLSGTPEWEDVRRAHRRAIVAAHPDAGGTAASAARLNQALDTLARVTERGRRPLPDPTPPPPRPAAPPAPAPRHHVRQRDPTEVLLRLADAAHHIGEVVFVDPDAGLLEVVVGEEPGVGQLTASVDTPSRDGVPVAFTLEPLGVTPAPRIEDVVTALMDRLRETERPNAE